MYPALSTTIAVLFLGLLSVSCKESEVIANYENERTFSSTTGTNADATVNAGDQQNVDVEAAALAIIQQKCARCHAGGSAQGGFGIIDDVDALIASNKYILPGNADGSAIYKRAGVARNMPPAGPLSDDEANTLKLWINAL